MSKFITLDRTHNTYTDASSLELSDDGLIVVGILPHGCSFKPATSMERDRLVEALRAMKYPGRADES